MRNPLFLKLLAAFLLVIAATAVAGGFFFRRVLETSLSTEIERNLKQKTLMFANRVNTDRRYGIHDIVSQEGQAAGARATVIDVRGKVLADSEVAASSMDDLSKAPEFVAALRGDVGSHIRLDPALKVSFLDVAAPVSGGAARLEYPLSGVFGEGILIRNAMVMGGIVGLLLAILVAAFASRSFKRRLGRVERFSKRIAAGELEARIEETAPDELGRVEASLDVAAQQLERSFTSLQEKRHELETLLNSMQEAVVTIGPDERVQWANHSMDQLVPQRTRLNAAIVETVRDPDFLRAVREVSETRMPAVVRASSIVPGRAFEVTAAPLPGGGAVLVLRDLTETERVEKTRRDFIANVSHELRTPLTSIQGYAETLLDTAADGSHSHDFLEIIRKNAARMSRLTEDLLTLARVESGEQRFDVRPVSTGDLLQEAVQNFREIAGEQGVEIDIKDAAYTEVSADPEAIQQIFSNLIENALKYGTPGKRISLGASSVDDAVEFYVRDFGPGISSEHIPRLFERFYRVDRARSRESGGTGLGLAIAKHIVLVHGGTIRAESELNHGSTFFFTLPRANAGVA